MSLSHWKGILAAFLLVAGCGGTDGSGVSTPGTRYANPPPTTDNSSDGFDAFQHHNLEILNRCRATLNLAPLVLDTELSQFALTGSQQETQDHIPHAHFLSTVTDGSIWADGFNTVAAENQGDPAGWATLASDAAQNEMDQIDATLSAMFDEGPGDGEAHGHYTNLMNPDYARLGVGLVEMGGRLYVTNDFSD